MKICLILGTRPQIIKSWSLYHACKAKAKSDLVVLHTGQHWSEEMAGTFYKELGMYPNDFLNLDRKNEGVTQLKEMIGMINYYITVNHKYQPDVIVVPGDTRSALAGALVASYNGIPLVHIESGLRCGQMIEEEKNRILIDNLSQLLCCPTRTAIDNLKKTEVKGEILASGDTHYDSFLNFKNNGVYSPTLGGAYNLLTIHRKENLNPTRLREILTSIPFEMRCVFPIHPHTKEHLESLYGTSPEMISPVGYLEILSLIKNANHIYTDSGGVQREAYWSGKPCTVLRESNEWDNETSVIPHDNSQFGNGDAGILIRDRILEMF